MSAWSVGELRPSGCIKRQIVRGSTSWERLHNSCCEEEQGAVFAEDSSQMQGGAELGLSSQSNVLVQPATTLGANSNPLALRTFFPTRSLCHVVSNKLLEFLNQTLHFQFFCWNFPPYWGLTMDTARKVSGPPPT